MAKKNEVSAKAARIMHRAVRHILQEPRRYCQSDIMSEGAKGDLYSQWQGREWKFPACGTVGCFGGWIYLLEKKRARVRKGESELEFATRVLGLSSAQSDSIFGLASDWPQPFRDRYYNSKTHAAKARVLQSRVEHLIKTGE